MTGDGAVVVPVVSAGSSVECFRSFGRRGIPTVGVSDRPFGASSRSKYCDETVAVPDPEEDLAGYARALLDVARRPDVATVVPLRELDVHALATRREEFAEHVAAPWPGPDAFESVRDRYRLYEHARRADVAVPDTAPVDEWDGWDDVTVVKSRYSVMERNGGKFYAHPRFFRGETAPDGEAIESMADEMNHVPMAQEYVPGDREHGFYAICDEGEPKVTFQHRRVRSYSYTGGASTYRESVRIPELAAAGTRLLRELNWHGPAMVEFKHDPRTDELKLMEVNPRFWGSLPLSRAAGLDFPYRYYQLAAGELDRVADTYEAGVGCHILRGEISYLVSILTEEYDHVDPPPFLPAVRDVLSSIVAEPQFDYLDLDDPLPFVHDIGRAASTLL